MGSTVSSISGQSGPPATLSWPELDDIPESFIALVLSSFQPPVIAKLARINRDFHAASSAEFIWVSKLPPTYPYIISKLCDQSMRDKCKKDLYAGLCRPNPFDGGTKEVWIDRRTGGVCLAISSKALAITGIMIGGIGITFQLMNLGFRQLHTCTRYGGFK